MSITDRLVLWLHIGFAIFAIGPVALAISSTPRYIRKRDLPVVRYLARITVVFTILSLGVLIAGIILGQLNHDFSHPWLTASATLYLVALVLLALVIRDQRQAVRALEGAGSAVPAAAPGRSPAAEPRAAAAAGPGPDSTTAAAPAAGPASSAQVATVERGRIAMMGGVVNLIWLVILVLMIWNS